MHAIVATHAGGSNVLRPTDTPIPAPQSGELLVKVAASGLNFIDIYRREGRYPMPFPHIPGSEGSGWVVAVGDGTREFAPGDEVAWAESAAGSYAEYTIVAAKMALPVPAGIDLEPAAALPLQGMTAHYLATSTYAIRPGDVALVYAAAGGVGLLLTQLVVLRGGRVLGCVGSSGKVELALSAGAEHVLVMPAGDPTEAIADFVRKHTGGYGVDVVYDGVGRATFDASIASLRPRGMFALYGGASGAVPPFDPQRLNTAGSLFLTRPSLSHYTANREELMWRSGELFDLVSTGRLTVRVGARFALADAAAAHQVLEGRETTGKVLLIP